MSTLLRSFGFRSSFSTAAIRFRISRHQPNLNHSALASARRPKAPHYYCHFGTSAALRRQAPRFPQQYQRFQHRQAWRNDPRLVKLFWIAVGGVGGYYVFHLERTETGRWRFIDVSEAQERAMGEQASEEVLQQYRHAILPDSDRRVQQVKRVAFRLIRSAGLDAPDSQGLDVLHKYGTQTHPKSTVNWRVFVIRAPDEKNAFVLPDGSIFVFSGLFSVAGTEDGLASIIGHEMSHQILRHSGERMSTAKLTQLLVFFLSLFGVDYSLGNTALTFLMSLPNSRAQEAEADHVGLLLSSGACYKPEESVQVWKRFQQSEKAGQVPGFLSTHPTHANRIEALQGWLDEARQVQSQKCEAAASQYDAFTKWTPT